MKLWWASPTTAVALRGISCLIVFWISPLRVWGLFSGGMMVGVAGLKSYTLCIVSVFFWTPRCPADLPTHYAWWFVDSIRKPLLTSRGWDDQNCVFSYNWIWNQQLFGDILWCLRKVASRNWTHQNDKYNFLNNLGITITIAISLSASMFCIFFDTVS